MQKTIKAVLFVNLLKNNAKSTAEQICSELESRNVSVTVFSFEGHPQNSPEGSWDIAFSLGGDGTVLYTARMMSSSNTPIIPVNLGTLGFLGGVESKNWVSVYEQWLNNSARISKRCMLEISVNRNGHNVFEGKCLNDLVISSLGIARLIRLKLEIEESTGIFTGLGYYRSDGLIVATPTGSTAYSMAAGGPILDPEMEAQIINPICSFSLSSRPIVLPSRLKLLINVESEQRSGVLLTVDGQDTFQLQPDDKITVNHSPHYALLLTQGYTSYYTALKEKFAWQGGDKNNA